MDTTEIEKKYPRPEIPTVNFPYEVVNEGVHNPEVVWTSTIFDYGGYALMSRNYIRGLCNRGMRIGVEAIRGTSEVGQEDC